MIEERNVQRAREVTDWLERIFIKIGVANGIEDNIERRKRIRLLRIGKFDVPFND